MFLIKQREKKKAILQARVKYGIYKEDLIEGLHLNFKIISNLLTEVTMF